MDIRKFPAVQPRLETGPIQLGDDWPGVFIRGDNAFAFVLALNTIVDLPSNDPIARAMLIGLRDTLSSCVVKPEQPAQP